MTEKLWNRGKNHLFSLCRHSSLRNILDGVTEVKVIIQNKFSAAHIYINLKAKRLPLQKSLFVRSALVNRSVC